MMTESFRNYPESIIGKKTSNSESVEKKSGRPEKVLSPRAEEFPKSSDEGLNAILKSVNTEYKSATLCVLDSKPRTVDDLKKILKQLLIPPVKPLGTGTIQDYCEEVFIPAGLVERIFISKKGSNVPHYRYTEDGIKYKPIAQLSIKTAVENKKSMSEILGRTSSRGKTNSPYNTARILQELKKKDNFTLVELASNLGLSEQTVQNNLIRLKKAGIVIYDSLSTEESGWSKYKWIGEKSLEDIVPIKRRPCLTREVALEMQEKENFDTKYLTKAFGKNNASAISKILSSLEKQKFIEPVGELGGLKRSNASITEKGRSLIFFELLEKNDFSGVNKEIEIFNDNSIYRRYITEAFKLYEKVSMAFKRVPKEDNKNAVLSMLKNQSLRAKQIDEKLGKKAGVYLRELKDSGEIETEKKGIAVFYSLKPKK